MDRFEGAVVLVTGGATGLGAAVADLAARAGAKVAVLDINEIEGRQTAERVGGGYWTFDVSSPESWRSTLPSIEQKLGPIRFAHLNAGIMTQRLDAALSGYRLEDVSFERYHQVLSTNLDGVFLGLQALRPRISAAGGGAITVTSSVGGLSPIPFDPIYALTKHGIIGLIRSLSAAEPHATVRLNAVCPGGFSSILLPKELQTPDTMTPADVAEEVIDLLLRGPMGEARLKLQAGTSEAAPPPSIPVS